MGYKRGGKAHGGGRGSGNGRGVGKGEDGGTEPESSTSNGGHGKTHGLQHGLDHGSAGEAARTWSGRQTLPPPLNTRAANKNTHPGAIVAPTTRRSSEVVQAERLRLEELRASAEEHQTAAISRIAELEDQMALQDKEKLAYAHRPRIPPDLPPRATYKRPRAAIEPSEGQQDDDEGLY